MNESTHRSVLLVYLRHYTIILDSYYPASHLVDSHSQAIHIYWRFISNYREATGLTHNNTLHGTFFNLRVGFLIRGVIFTCGHETVISHINYF